MFKGDSLKVIHDCKRHKSLIPLLGMVALVGIMASGSLIHEIIHSPDVQLNRWNIKQPYSFNKNKEE
jgi:hypothetical protein